MHFSVNLDQFMHYYILHKKDVIILLFNARKVVRGGARGAMAPPIFLPRLEIPGKVVTSCY